MPTTRKLLVAAITATLVAACHDVPTEPAEPPRDEFDLPTHTSHDGDTEQQPEETFDPSTYRVVFTFTAESELSPKAPVSLLIEGVAIEPVTGGELVVTLPTKAAMDYAGPGNSLYFPAGMKPPVAGKWTLPAMETGARWKQRITIPAMEKGYYHVALNALTRGPPSDLGPFLIDDVYHQAWMFVSDRGATLTEVFDETLFPEGTPRVPGPIRARGIDRDAGDMAAFAATDTATRRYVYAEVTYYHGSSQGFLPAAGVEITGAYYRYGSGTGRSATTRIVPENGIVKFTCPGSNVYLKGNAIVPRTSYVHEGISSFVKDWRAYKSDCGDTITVQGYRDVYMPWNHLNESARLIEDHFGHSRTHPVRWRVERDQESSKYTPWRDRITFNRAGFADEWTAAHEYTHAFHHKALGGMWSTDNCSRHSVFRVSSYTCAFSEGIADYGGDVGAPNDTYLRNGWENFTTSDTGTKGKIEGYVAALFHDLIDGGTETDDETEYSGDYVMTVFKTCYVKVGARRVRSKRNDVSDFVWCLENRVNEDVHDDHFPGISAPKSAHESATEPDDWDADDIRSTWILNVG